MSEHTPGPWALSQQNGLCLYVVANGEPIAEPFRVESSGGFDATLFANARLMAAAPELLKALDNLIQQISEREDKHDERFASEILSACATGEAAIRKAKGE